MKIKVALGNNGQGLAMVWNLKNYRWELKLNRIIND